MSVVCSIYFVFLEVAPAELEALLLTHESVEDCGVVGVPDADAGELPKAFIVTKPGHTLTAQQVHEFMKGIRYFTFIPCLKDAVPFKVLLNGFHECAMVTIMSYRYCHI